MGRGPLSSTCSAPWRSREELAAANHQEVIVALDFFTVPTITFQLLYSLFVRSGIVVCDGTRGWNSSVTDISREFVTQRPEVRQRPSPNHY
jgi:hypothetical protein